MSAKTEKTDMQLCHQSHKRHIQAKHAEHLQGYPIPDSLKKVKQFEEKEYGKEDADDPDRKSAWN